MGEVFTRSGADLYGSSFYKLLKFLQWLTGNIGYHHVHHLSPRVPNYKLEEVHQEVQPLQNVPTITLAASLRSLKLYLWDEQGKKTGQKICRVQRNEDEISDIKTIY